MAFLRDEDVITLISTTPKLAEDVQDDGFRDRDSSVQACSLDLTIGDVFVPGTKDGELGSTSSPLRSLSLEQGHTAIVRTKEVLNLPSNMGAIGFPPSRVSINGLLMTNPGHVEQTQSIFAIS